METTSLYAAQKTANAAINTGVAGGALGKDQFMEMLVVQMQNQDPMEPMDNSEMTAQLAQFSSLEQMENLNSQFEGFQQSTTAAMSLMNSGNEVVMELNNGSAPITGVLEKVQWSGGATQFVVNGELYNSSEIKSLTAAVKQDAPSENTAAPDQTGDGSSEISGETTV